VFYGWVIVAVSLLSYFVGLGLPFYSFGPVLKDMQADLGASGTQIGFSISLLSAVSILAGPAVGWLVDRGSIRRTMIAGALLLAAGIWSLSRVQNVTQLWAVYTVPIPIGMALLGGVASPRLLSNWFHRSRGLALGLAMTGVSICGVTIPVALGEMVAATGWRSAMASLTLLPLALLPFLLLVHDEPAQRGLRPDGMDRELEVSAELVRDPGFWSVVRARAFWLIAFCYGPLLAANSGLVSQAYAHAQDLGLERAEAGLVVTAMAICGAIGKPVYGLYADRLGPRRALGVAIALMILGLVFFLKSTGIWSLILAGAVFGFGFAGLVAIQAVLAAQIFGREVLGRVLGVLGIGTLPLVFAANPFMGWIHDETGRYGLAFMIFIGGCALSALLLLLIPGRERAPEAPAAA